MNSCFNKDILLFEVTDLNGKTLQVEDGSKVLFEEYNKGRFYLNQMLLFGTHYSSLNVYQQTAQPHPGKILVE
jgi:hypothetical protein